MNRRTIIALGALVVVAGGAFLFLTHEEKIYSYFAVEVVPQVGDVPITEILPAVEIIPAPYVPVHLETPKNLAAIYMSSWVSGSKTFRAKLVSVLDTTDANAVVIDMKDSTGRVSFKTDNTLINDYGSTEKRVGDIVDFIKLLHEKNIYVIARISVFQDGYLPKKYPELAIQTKTGAPWKDRGGNYWLDMYAPEITEYIKNVSDEAIRVGFDEINLDYIRFPSEGDFNDAVFPSMSEDTRTKAEVIRDFVSSIHDHVKVQNIPLSIDVFGYVASRPDDVGIGQQLEMLAPVVEYIAPMVYPSHYYTGSFNIKKPAEHPYEIISSAMAIAVTRLVKIGQDPNKIRPWIQDFNMGATYTTDMVQKQIQATHDAGLTSFMVWDPANTYTAEALIDTQKLFTPKKEEISNTTPVQ